MSKRPRSESPSPSRPSPKQRKAVSRQSIVSTSTNGGLNLVGQEAGPSAHSIGDIFTYQELFIRILSFLSPTELARVQSVNKYWSRMSVDPQLWKRLYLSRYPHPHHSRLIYKDTKSGTSTPTRLRPIARLPSRAFPPPSPSRSPSVSSIAGGPSTSRSIKSDGKGVAVPLNHREDGVEVGHGIRNDGVDWKVMLRLGTNWSNGNALSQTSISLPPSPSPSIRSIDADTQLGPPTRPPPYSEQHIALFPSYIFTSNPTSPLVNVHRASSTDASSALGIIPPPPGWSSPSRPDNVTAICGDQSVSQSDAIVQDVTQSLPARIAVFYQSGGFVVLRVTMDGDRLHWIRELIHPAQYRPKSVRRRSTYFTPLEGDPVVLATMHHPVLITCTLSFHVSVYSLAVDEGSNCPKHLSTMHSDVSFHPAALSLFPTPAEDDIGKSSPSFRAALTYCSPLYPSSWTIAVQEFGVDLNRYSGDVWRGECCNVGRGDEADDEDEIWPRKIRPIVGVKGSRAVGVGTDGRWCVLAGEDNQIQVYSLPTPSPSPPPSRPSPILHAQTLLAHSSAVTSISLNAGRCVSGGRDGRVLVWELDEDIDTEEQESEGKIGRTVGYVEVRPGGRRWKCASGPQEPLDDREEDVFVARGQRGKGWEGLPHPASISHAARSLFLPRPPDVVDDRPPAIRQLAFDEERIVGLVRVPDGGNGGAGGEVMKVWGFNG